jgi:hypothetical protein
LRAEPRHLGRVPARLARLGNYRVNVRDRRGENYNWWIDDTQAPLKKA